MSEQDKIQPVQEFVEKDIWKGVQEFLNFGLHLGEGDNSIHITVGLLIALALVFVGTSLVLKWMRNFFTRKMEDEDRLKFFSVFKFVRYLIYVVVILLTMSAAGIDITLLMDNLFNEVMNCLTGNEGSSVAFSNLVPSESKHDKVLTFIPLLHLKNARKI